MIWRNIFIELAIRAIRRTCYEYGNWGLGQNIKEVERDPRRINQNLGFLVANEPSICDAITHEYITSPLTNGSFIDQKERSYLIDREVTFSKTYREKINEEWKDSKWRKKVDLVLMRYIKEDNKIKIADPPTLMEVKRFHYFTPDLRTGNPGNPTVKEDGIIDDIQSLNKITCDFDCNRYRFSEMDLTDFNRYVFFWGLYSLDERSHVDVKQKPENIISKYFSEDIKGETLYEYIPLKWNKNEVTDWIWIYLCEIQKKEFPEDRYVELLVKE